MSKNFLDPLRNPLDPLRNTKPEGKEIFVEFCKVVVGRQRADVLDAMSNLLVNILREMDDTQKKANDHVDQFSAATKRLLDKHYTSTGRRNIFPHTQVIDVPYLGKLDKH